jgi:hypothetical protein
VALPIDPVAVRPVGAVGGLASVDTMARDMSTAISAAVRARR